jgi:hypothetical protein
MKAVFPYSLRLFVIFSEKDEVKIQIVKHSFKDVNWYYLSHLKIFCKRRFSAVP